ncbi:MAG: hypothetical protein KF784_15945 [Fimbriimonadaceae bacterium]|nr:hypothetical protein [Fimbriimonadaceae bacterium]MDR4465997.1 arginine deiminase family protein [Nitrospira sp.]MDR4467949.1 arginine deiminase family protein [Nitrospira sp.]
MGLNRPADGAEFPFADTDKIRVDVRSETDRLATVVMCWANPYTIDLMAILSLFESSVRKQLRHNFWSTYDWRRVRVQQECLAQRLREYGVEVLLLENIGGICSQHYTRDIGFSVDDVFFVARMGSRYRRSEVRALGPLLPRLSRVMWLERGRIEGGDVMVWGEKVLVGLGEATDLAGIEELRRRLVQLGSPREVLPLHFPHQGVIHLDTKFNVVGESIAVFARHSFAGETLRWFERHFDLIDATEDEVRGLGINALTIGNGNVILDERCERLAGELTRRGLVPIPIDYSEVTQWPGAFRCTTLPLRRIHE